MRLNDPADTESAAAILTAVTGRSPERSTRHELVAPVAGDDDILEVAARLRGHAIDVTELSLRLPSARGGDTDRVARLVRGDLIALMVCATGLLVGGAGADRSGGDLLEAGNVVVLMCSGQLLVRVSMLHAAG